MMKAEPARLPFWHERQILADAKRDDRRAAVLNRFARAVRRQIAVNRLAGFGAPGIGGLLEEARKKGELRNTQTVMAARKLRDTDGEALVLDFARVEEERHEAVAGLALEVVINRAEQGRQAEQIEKLKQEKEKAEREMGREQRLREVMQEEAGRLRERLRREAMRMERLMADERRKAERLAKAERKAMGREIRQLENQVNQGWQEEVGELKSEIKQLRQLTDLMVTGKKRARRKSSSTRPSAISSAWTSVPRSANWLPPSQLLWHTSPCPRRRLRRTRRTSRRRSASLRK